MPAKDRDPLAGEQYGDTREAMSGYSRESQGVGIAERHMVQATRMGRFPDDGIGGMRSQGETPGSGALYAAVLNERPNISNPRNQGPTRAPSRVGGSMVPNAVMMTRHTGRIS